MKKKNVDVIILIEHLARELESAVLLRYELQKSRLSVEIKSVFYDYYDVLQNYRCRLLVVPYCYDNKDYDTFSNIDCKYILNLHQEQIDTLTTNNLLPREDAVDTIHVSWGECFTEELKGCNIDEELIYQTGSIRNDFLNPKFSFLSLTKEFLAEKYAVDVRKPWILIAGNFSKIYFVEKDLPNPRYPISKYAVQTYYEVVDWLKSLMEEFHGTYEVIYRPHPTESFSDEMKRLQDEYPQFHFVREENLRDWVINSDYVFAYRSTSAIDAAIAKKPTFLLRPFILEDRFELPILNKMDKITTKSELIDVIRNERKPGSDLDREISYHYDANDGNAYMRLCDVIKRVLTSDCAIPERKCYREYGLNRRMFFLLKHIVKKYLNVFNKVGLLTKFENFRFDTIRQEKIEELEKKMSILDSASNV